MLRVRRRPTPLRRCFKRRDKAASVGLFDFLGNCESGANPDPWERGPEGSCHVVTLLTSASRTPLDPNLCLLGCAVSAKELAGVRFSLIEENTFHKIF